MIKKIPSFVPFFLGAILLCGISFSIFADTGLQDTLHSAFHNNTVTACQLTDFQGNYHYIEKTSGEGIDSARAMFDIPSYASLSLIFQKERKGFAKAKNNKSAGETQFVITCGALGSAILHMGRQEKTSVIFEAYGKAFVEVISQQGITVNARVIHQTRINQSASIYVEISSPGKQINTNTNNDTSNKKKKRYPHIILDGGR